MSPALLGRAFHRDHPCDLLTDGRVQEALEQPHLETGRHDFLQNAFRRWKEFVFGVGGLLRVCHRVFDAQERTERQAAFRPSRSASLVLMNFV